ncbi:MAG: shikimate kinase [Candidatus Eremiobacteraeota bacterium]|nr:shikimate kinase [Candidatus Eremiobacteraeota bacterium]MBV8332684.1 shikimate kinase [Candidatus Eremiobacteraeota bacterium]MBV8435828.1 shikimate kinase [Candidatus Eremiobacteraeota bacterium]MBV8654891.1 shikimate kinase [Candidatus Eremiobacteraeota bacterium]MBV8723105.1 shikimate kinase [Candidatus Eremiobacteraeota bacterium]
MRRHIALVGFMAAGKSTIGKRLARRMKVAFFDVDDLVVRDHGAISDIFYNEGEAAFRRYEKAALAGVLEDGEPGIVALGGGALTLDDNQKLLKKRAYRVFVKVSPEQALERMRRSKVVRPLLGPTPSLMKIRDLYTKRMPQYAHADHVVEVDDLTTSQAVDNIIEWLHKKKIHL